MQDNRTSRAGEAASAEARCGTDPPHRILVVDDDSGIRQLSARVLIPCGYEVDTAEDGAVAWEALHANRYDLLITDYNMPKVSGVELVKKLRSARMALPVILASGAMPAEELNRHPWLQLAATLRKPFTGDELLGTVKKVLRGTDSACEPLPIWRSQPSADGLSL
jgi:DNA-binding response OmpR family regulator